MLTTLLLRSLPSQEESQRFVAFLRVKLLYWLFSPLLISTFAPVTAINLSRTVSDLSGRVQELEVEAGELRSENKSVARLDSLPSTQTFLSLTFLRYCRWLKQLVLTKAQGNAQSGA